MVSVLLQSLTPPQLAGVLGAILTGENINKTQVWVAYKPSKEVTAAVEALEPDREQLARAQAQHNVAAPLFIDLRLAGEQPAFFIDTVNLTASRNAILG